MARNPFRRIRPAQEQFPEVDISEEGNIRSLHLGSPTVQSSMDLDDPTRLVLSYSRFMMAWLLFGHEAEHVVQIGLGGGSFARWLDCYLPDVRDTVIEINPQVITVARGFFELPFEGEDQSFEVVQADGAEYIKIFRESVDVIMVDGFDGLQIVDDLVTEDFFVNCHHALSDEGIFVTNWWRNDKRYDTFIVRLRRVFEGYVLEIPAENRGNMAVMAFKNKPRITDLVELRKKAEKFSNRYHLDFEQMVTAIKNNNITSGQQLYFSTP